MNESDGAARDLSLEPARAALRNEQAKWAGAIHGVEPSVTTWKDALARIDKREAASISDGSFTRVGVFKYDRSSERARWELTREIIDRAAPGPYEHPRFLELLAYQAASIELWIRQRAAAATVRAVSRVLVGTTAQARHHAFSDSADGAVFIAVSAGMIDFLYQCAKVVVLSAKQIPPQQGAAYGLRMGRATFRENLAENPYPATLLRNTLLSWLYEGRARPLHSGPVPATVAPFLQLLVDGWERFLLAHEYGHALMDFLGPLDEIDLPSGKEISNRDKEFRADTFAFSVVASSSDEIDWLTSDIALQGAALVMKAHSIIRSAEALARHGGTSAPWKSSTHPSFDERAEALRTWYLAEGRDLDSPVDRVGSMMQPAETLDEVWQHVRPSLSANHLLGRDLYPIWNA